MSKSLTIDTKIDRLQGRALGTQDKGNSATTLKQRNLERVFEEGQDENEQEDQEELDEDDDSTFTSSPSIPDENINFDLVYTLRTFVATVDGQASVTKGDALTLLDDSNSYWWLVSVLKTSEVGYIPAENIETPFERLARLNKHRNAEITTVAQVPFLKEKPKAVKRRPKKVAISKDKKVQAQIILTDDDDNHEIGEAYEEWVEDLEDTEEDDDNESLAKDTPVPDVQANKTETRRANLKQPLSPSQKADSAGPPEDKRLAGNSSTFWNLFTRGKKDAKPKSRPSEEDTNSITSFNSFTVSEDSQPPRQTPRQMPEQTQNTNQTVLRVFAGNINVNATYHSVLVNMDTSAEQLLVQAMERFHISQIENRTRGHPLRTTSTDGIGGVEYYLTVKALNGDEITLTPEDKPLAIFQSLTAHLTTPMPSLTQVRKLSPQAPMIERTSFVGTPNTSQGANKKRFGEDAVVRFYLHKRIRRVSDGQMFIKVFLYTGNNQSKQDGDQASRSTFSTRNLRRKKEQGSNRQEHIEKLIAVPASITVAELTEVALEKFHMTNQSDNVHYRMALVTPQTAEKLLNPNSKLAEILHDDTHGPRSTVEKRFILRKITPHTHRGTPVSNGNKVVPEKYPMKHSVKMSAGFGFRSPTPVTDLDANTQVVFRRLDAALLAFESGQRGNGSIQVDPKKTGPLTMTIARNTDNGVDIIMPHGILRSKTLPNRQIHCSLVAPVQPTDKTRRQQLQVIAQKVLQPTASPIMPSSNGVSDGDIAALVKYGMTFLENKEKQMHPSQKRSMARYPNGVPSLSLNSDILGAFPGQFSSMDDLESEFQRIIAAHAF